MVKARGGINTLGKAAKGHDVDVGRDEPHTVIPTEGDAIGDSISSIVGDSSHAELVEVVDLSEPIGAPVVNECIGDDVNVSSVDETVTSMAKKQSTEDLVENITPSVKDITMEDVESMETTNIPSVAGTDDIHVGILKMEETNVVKGVGDTLIDDTAETKIPGVAGQEKKKKSKKTITRLVLVKPLTKPKRKLSK
ncbi:hypothetical protein LIER_18745 [Lithospermum erythrorhizon]|uniref:Uncharacterized protein n=1 Tax=Lithospermum erythrorhizon TaxID=34254 RepID=A0AAV3QGD2_LITER